MNSSPLSLTELMALIRRAVETALPDACWVQAELSEVRENASGHCYMEFVESRSDGKGFAAKVRGVVWRGVYALLKPYFERETGQRLQPGMKVLVKVSVSFHEQYGLSLVVTDIDPTYTLGDMARRRREILSRLEQEGVIDMNRELELPMPVQRIAVISSGTAAGYGDFCHQLSTNSAGLVFYTRLFPARMQGEGVAASIIAALGAIADGGLSWDAVVIIRGGGAVSDLNGFESYDLACNCAQFPLPIITGIGHERDDTVIDFVAHTRCKTPTAVADFLISRALQALERMEQSALRLRRSAAELLVEEKERLQRVELTLPRALRARCESEHRHRRELEARLRLQVQQGTRSHYRRQDELSYRLRLGTTALLTQARHFSARQQERWQVSVSRRLEREGHRLDRAEQTIRLMGPEHLFRLGYSVTLKDGRAVTDASVLQPGDRLVTRLAKGEIESEVKQATTKQTT